MSWSLPRLYFKPQRDNRSRELSVSRPLFCTAIFKRMESPEPSLLRIEFQPLGDRPVAAVARHKKARDAADGGDADAGLTMNLAIRQAALQQFDHGPTIRHRLQFRGRAQIAEEAAALI